jgi:hypothetical protein
MHDWVYAVQRKVCAYWDWVDQGKAVTKLMAGGRDVRVHRNKMGSLKSLFLFGASSRQLREQRGK